MKEEESFIKKAQAGEAEAFAWLYDKHIKQIYRFVYLKVTHRANAEDLTQQIFLNAWQNIRNYQSQGFPFSSWLYRIAGNAVIDHYRTEKHHVAIETISEDALAFEPDNKNLDREMEIQTIKKAIAGLEADQQSVVIMKFVEDMNNKEIAAALDKSEGAVRVIQHRALKKLKDLLQEKENIGKVKANL